MKAFSDLKQVEAVLPQIRRFSLEIEFCVV